MGVRLVVLEPQHTHSTRAKDSAARKRVEEILSNKGTSPRYCKNLLIFLAPDQSKIEAIVQFVCQYLAWNSIVQEKDVLNLDVFQSNQATTKRKQTDETVDMLLKEAYQWLLIPTQPDDQGAIVWEETRIPGSDSPILRASRQLVHEEHLIVNYAANRLCLEILNLYIWPHADRVDLKTLWKYLLPLLVSIEKRASFIRCDRTGSGNASMERKRAIWD
ncbi:hypothetical protein MiSe_71580 [Microseira wollei NIES-4236]|uniref:Uncharacterized protein n=2 Tax=Microseira wollei TaxID=467598 RepID=A0AAV3XRI8_9CYAN|nr:hypothetical protein MiSe_71580 [Microseira wollei NIES-4236]